MCELLTFLWSGRQNVSDSFFFSLLLTRRQCFWLESFHLRSKTWRLTFSSDCRRITAVHLYFFFWYTLTQVKLEQTRVCVFNSTCVGVCVHIWSVYILTNVGQRRILWILSLTFNSPPRTATGKRSGLRRWRNTDRTRTSVQSIRVEFVGLKHTIDRENKK